MFRALVAERFPDHAVLAEELGASGTTTSGTVLGVRFRLTAHEFAHGMPIFCASLALEIDRSPKSRHLRPDTPRAVYAERGGGRS
jgi:fructose-1,6-bisphosphatase/inositol monophosphatase family enzyme